MLKTRNLLLNYRISTESVRKSQYSKVGKKILTAYISFQQECLLFTKLSVTILVSMLN